LKYRIEDIPLEGTTLKGELEPDWLSQSLEGEEHLDLSAASPIVYRVGLVRGEATVSVRGAVKTTIRTSCSRCLEPFTLPIDSEFAFTLTPVPADRGHYERELLPEELDTEFYEGDSIDVGKILVQQIILSLPIKALCRENCLGLCPKCGINRNQETCTCSTDEPVDPRMAGLKKLLK